MNQVHSKNIGFTLIEVLIASVILFTSIVAVVLVYRGAFLSSQKANSSFLITSAIPVAVENIKSDIFESSSEHLYMAGKGKVRLVNYHWEAKLLSFKAPPRKLDLDSGNYIQLPKRYKLWFISITLEFEGSKRQFDYEELTW